MQISQRSRVPSSQAAPAIAPSAWVPTAELDAQQTSASQKIGFGLLLVFLFLLYGRVTDFFLPFLHIPMVTAVCCLVLLLFSGRLSAVLTSPMGMLLTGFSAWICLATPFSLWPGGSVQTLVDEWLRSFAVFLIAGGLIATLNQLLKAMTVLAWTFFVASLLTLFLGVPEQGRLALPVGLYSGPNEVAMAMLTGCVYWWWMFYKPPPSLGRKLISLVCIFPILYVLPKTASRGALVTVVFILPFLLLRGATRGKIILSMFLIVVLIGSVALLPQGIKARFATLLPADAEEQSSNDPGAAAQESARASTEQRWYLLKTSVILTLKHPLLGVGPGQFEVAENQRAADLGLPKGNWHGTHNTYTQISSEAGIPALLLFGGCIWICWRELVRIEKAAKESGHLRAKEIGMAAFALRALLFTDAVLFMFVHLGYASFFPTMAGMIFALSRIAKSTLDGESGGPEQLRGVAANPSSLPAFPRP
jgi:O-antigen ligase